MNYTPSITYKKYIAMITRVQDPTTTVHVPDVKTGERRESHVFYRVKVEGKQISLEGYIVQRDNNETNSLMQVHPEEDFVLNRNFWVSAPQHIFKDYNASVDKKNGKLSWAAAYDRETLYDTFYVDLNDPVVQMSFSIALLERLTAESAPVAKTQPTPASIISAVVSNSQEYDMPQYGMSITDTILDTPPKGATPSFLQTPST